MACEGILADQPDGSCVAASEPLSPQDTPLEVYVRQASPAFSTDGTCGAAHGGTICNPKSTVYTGGCCSVRQLAGSFYVFY
jgi:hypothetical protein